MLTREAANGNPVAIAMDRICAGDLEDPADALTCAIAGVAQYRRTPYDGVWTPDVLGG